MTYRFLKLIAWILPRLPDCVQKAFANLLGSLIWVLLSKRRKNKLIADIRTTLEISQEQAVDIGRKSVTRLGRMLTDIAKYPWLNKDNIGERVRFHGTHHLENALSHGRGVVLVTGHCGNWELMGYALTKCGFPLIAVVRQQKSSGLNDFLNEYRNLSGGTVLTKDDLRQVVKTMAQNKIPYIFIDIDALKTGVWVNFLGRWASTPPGAAILARMNNAPIVPAFITEAADGIHDVLIGEAIWVDQNADRDVMVREVMQKLTSILEQHVRAHPHEWLWMQERWRTIKPE